ncbi:hypothetical protein F5X68DRAFT_12318 [Plectosphaerella plurivora]|uniref:C2H2-type domain-containing protein n=1 Tax=Plectosphaerella plurivora TaxID=936078 RepID=A0A9P9ABI3_9PEZI|nr:hypothetical protein F5X68DRAFT_12318 [Plectosphaerella plurivora]
MLSNNPTRDLQARQRANHRRQTSTPSAFEATKIPAMPNIQQRQRALGHRRGLSLDTRRQIQMSPAATPTRQDFAQVSNDTNTGLATIPQHVLREAQQQRVQARPGPLQQNNNQHHLHHQQQQHHFLQQNFMSANDHENYIMSPHGTPQHQRFGVSCYDASPVSFDPYGGAMNLMVSGTKDNTAFGGAMMADKDFELFAADSPMSTPTFMNFNESPSVPQGWHSEGESGHSRRSSRRISNGIMDRVAKFETLGMDQAQRPSTPDHQNENGYFPPTPLETPHDRVKHEPVSRPNRFAEGYDESMEETLKPVRNKSAQRTQNIFEEMRRRAEEGTTQTPPLTTTIPDAQVFEGQMPTADFLNMNNFNSEFLKIHDGFDDVSDDMLATQDMSQPQTPHLGFPVSGPFDIKPEYVPITSSATGSPASTAHSQGGASSPHRGSSHRRTESLASIASAASIADINIEETKTDTGITIDDISTYIHGPDAENKWTCLFDDCGKKFGRKENIKSHVQTHLNDRQYQCPSCHKCFVRQHDLKRHAKIHTGIKPYPCECGNSFARHDALTRHRQRGMCIGAFDGIVKKVVKRGRPRKHRPEMDDRLDKSTRTRVKNSGSKSPMGAESSASSQSCYSDASGANSPEHDFNSGFNSSMGMDLGKQNMHSSSAPMPSMSSAPMPCLAPAPPPTASIEVPQHDFAPAASPSDMASQHSVNASPYVSPEEIMDLPSSLPHASQATVGSPSKSIGSQYNTPPELSQSSSPPPTTRYFDTAADPANTSLSSLGLSVGDDDEELLMKAFTNDEVVVGGLGGFDRDSSMLVMSKFDEFDDVDMFTNDDVFFGTS